MLITRLLRITGLVQGVGYRDSILVEAIALGIRGWVRNRSDASVEVLVHGESADVERLLQWARRGPRGARVDDLTIIEVSKSVFSARFERRPTL